VASTGKRGELSKSCSRATSLSRRRSNQFQSEAEVSAASAAAVSRSSSVPPPSSGTVLVRIKTGSDEKSATLQKPFRKQSIKIGGSESEPRSIEPPGSRQPLPLKRSCSANSEIRWQFYQLFYRQFQKLDCL
jgi:hypothetical protein